ncbi:hypothetical protein K431DRAFT_284974 [Polychaeton citri CBS 116435]|uniref:DNA-directed RNA polymerase subunit n=1 Tax=Polychaeton citri CBS 116435 TaxID=1314669 RepID=A0A9P4QAK3_9PEZI|nr:hypothetical protein K431DRAFT_284974 [Polychaeton citri CBS 116435]
MSSEPVTPEKKSRKQRDDTGRKPSKKRKHEEQDAEAQTAKREDSPVKKQKKGKEEKKHSRSQEVESITISESQQQAGPASQSVATTKVIDDSDLESHSPYIQKTASLYLALSPVAYHFPLEGLCAEYLSPLLLTYYAPLEGVVLSYSNHRLSEHPSQGVITRSNAETKKPVLSRSVDEYAVTYVWLTADFTLFRPSKGTVLEGYVNLQNEGILGLMCYNYFNTGIERNRLPPDWKWISNGGESLEGKKRKVKADAPGDGYFVDGSGQNVEGRIVFRVRDFEAGVQSETGTGTINILGSLLSEAEDRKVDIEERERGKKKSKS